MDIYYKSGVIVFMFAQAPEYTLTTRKLYSNRVGTVFKCLSF